MYISPNPLVVMHISRTQLNEFSEHVLLYLNVSLTELPSGLQVAIMILKTIFYISTFTGDFHTQNRKFGSCREQG